MASEGKKILMFDEATGMLSKEVMLAYVHNELSPAVKADVEKYLANDEMHRDIIEGMRQVAEKNQFEKTLQSINEMVAEKTGAPVKSEGYSFELPAFLTDFKKIAAVLAGIMIIAGIIFTVMNMKEDSSGIALNEPEKMESEQAPVVPSEPEVKLMQDDVAQETEEFDSAIVNLEEVDEDASMYQEIMEPEESPIASVAEPLPKKQEAVTGESRAAAAAKKSIQEERSVPQQQAAVADDPKVTDVPAVSGADAGMDKRENENAAFQTQTAERVAYADAVDEEADPGEATPQFPGGEEALKKYIKDNLNYPKSASENNVQGNVYLTFMVGTTGRVKDIRVEKGVTKDINAEAIRLVTNMPKWNPGTQKGKPAAMKRVLIIEFALE